MFNNNAALFILMFNQVENEIQFQLQHDFSLATIYDFIDDSKGCCTFVILGMILHNIYRNGICHYMSQ